MSLRITILSPHFDDAAYGLTLTISRLISNSIPVTLVNCFTVTKWTAIPVSSKEIKEVSLLRAKEDADYNCLFGSQIKIINLDLLDAPLRNGYIFQQQPLQDNELELAEVLKEKLQDTVEGILLCPMAIGSHIDHVICLEAVSKLYSRHKVIFYEDLPYARRISMAEIEEQANLIAIRLNSKFVNHINLLSNCTIDKEMAIRVYQSQMNDEICSEILSHMKSLEGERLWGEPELLEELRLAINC